MISIFSNKATNADVLSKNGIYDLTNMCSSCVINEKANSNYDAELTFLLNRADKEVYDFISEDAILKIEDEYSFQPFRICSVRKNLNNIEVVARHITIADALNSYVKDCRPTNQTGGGALQELRSRAENNTLMLQSDITDINTAYFLDASLHDCLFNLDQSFLNRWGGECVRDNFTIRLNAKAGQDAGVQIRSAKNLTGFQCESNIDELCTRIVAKGYDRLRVEEYIDSDKINLYSKPFTKEIKFDDVKVKDESNSDGFETEAEAIEELKARASLKFTEDKVDELKCYYKVNFVYLADTLEYKDYVGAERVNIWDWVTVIEDNYNIELKTRVIGRKFDVLARKRLETELSNHGIPKPLKVDALLKEIEKAVGGGNTSVADYITAMMQSGLQNSHVVARDNEILVMDSKDINTAVKVVRLNKNGLGFSQNGYYGSYEYGFTIDGVINASLIQTGVLSAILIQSLDGNLQIDLSNSNAGVQFKSNGCKAIDIKKNIIRFYDWEGTTRVNSVGSIFAGRSNSDANKTGVMFSNNENSYLALGYWDKQLKSYYSYINFDNDKVLGSDTAITFYKETKFNNIKVNKIVGRNEGDRSYLDFWDDNIQASTFMVNGDLGVTGNKNCIQSTATKGDRYFYSVEDAGSWLTYTEAKEIQVDSQNKAVIMFDEVYRECINSENDYIVEIHKTSFGDYKVQKFTDKFIIVSSRADFTFNYVLKCKRRGYEDKKLDVCVTTKQANITQVNEESFKL